MKRLATKLLLLVVFSVAAPQAAQPIDFTTWHTPSQIDQILTDFVTTYPSLCALSSIGTSVEGRQIKALKISNNPAVNDPSKGDVVIMATHHAREWLSTETALYIAEQLLTRYTTDAQIQADVNQLQIWIIPVVNPDGFAHTQTADRYWRKNRRDNGDGTFGVDLNRNYGYQWGLASGSSPFTSDDTYRGTGPFSEPEVAAIRDFLQTRTNLKTILTYHSYSELFLRPWAYTTDDPPGEPTLAALAQRSIAVIQAVHGHTYTENIWYTSSGETTDFTWGTMRVSGFTPEVRPSPTGPGGFNPPTTEIIPNIEENFAAARALIHDAGARELWIRDYVGDTGAEPSAIWTSAGWSHPFWTSPDIWTVPATLDQGATVTLNIRITNNTGTYRTGVRVDAYWTDPRISLEFPNPDAHLIASQTGLTVPPFGLTVSMPWTVPIGTNSWGERHWCVGAIVMHVTDLPLTTQAERSSNVAIHNFVTTETLAATSLIVAATNFLAVDAELAAVVDTRSIPAGWRVVLGTPPKTQSRVDLATAIGRKGRLLNAKGPLLAPGETIYLPVHIDPPKNAKAGDTITVPVHAALMPLLPGKRTPVGNGYTYKVVIPAK
jgi:murein tripeptide amidase MpaA